jgi:hypothetical protein
VRVLALHSDPALTLGVYSHVGALDLARGLEGLSALTRVVSEAKTGTYDNSIAHALR